MGRKRFVNKSNKERKNREKGSKQVIPHSSHRGSPVYPEDRDHRTEELL